MPIELVALRTTGIVVAISASAAALACCSFTHKVILRDLIEDPEADGNGAANADLSAGDRLIGSVGVF